MFFLLMFSNVCNANTDAKIKGMLLYSVKEKRGCGIIYFVEKVVFKITSNFSAEIKKGDTVTLFLPCPGDYNSELIVGKVYSIYWERSNSSVNGSTIVSVPSFYEDFRCIGIIKDFHLSEGSK